MNKDVKILLVDDEVNVLRSCKRVLRKLGLAIDTESNPNEALKRLAQEPYAIVVSDQKMPQMSGSEFLEKTKAILPDAIRIILTGYADIDTAIAAINKGSVWRYLAKPWNDDDLVATIKQALDEYNLVQENRRLNQLTLQQNEKLKDLNENLEQKVEQRTAEIQTLNQQLEKSFLASIDLLAQIGEMHHSRIANHSKRVCQLAKFMAQRMGLDEKEIFDIEIAAKLHDIGKITIPLAVLTKDESKLIKEETALIEKHPLYGESIVAQLPDRQRAALIVRHHHENFNGTGYPDGLKGDQIPLGSRLLAVADAFDKTLNSKGPYASASAMKALQIVMDQAVSTLDPKIVKVLKQCVRDEKTLGHNDDEIEILLHQLDNGMTLSRDLKTARGILLVKRETTIGQDNLNLIKKYLQSCPLTESIYIYR